MHVLDEIDVNGPESLFQSPEVIQKSQFLPSKVLQANYFYFNADNRKTKDFIKTHKQLSGNLHTNPWSNTMNYH